ncbi:MAG: 6-phosphogluconolactonase [Dokdonella sp.]
MNESTLQGDPRIDWHASENEETWVENAADAVVSLLRDGLRDANGKVRLLVSGGSTPGPVYRRLAKTNLDWSRVLIGLVDDRDVPADDKGSNARAIREQLLQARAAAATFQPLREIARTLDGAIEQANQRWLEATDQPIVAALLGMGDDGHTASLFPGASNLDVALSASQPYLHIDASGCEVSGEYPQRLSLTPFGLAQASWRLLLIRGSKKRDTLMAALSDGPINAMPIRLTWQAPSAPLQVHWCADE